MLFRYETVISVQNSNFGTYNIFSLYWGKWKRSMRNL